MKYLIAYIATASVFLICDVIWLGFVARDFYRAQIGYLMADSINLWPAIGFYLLYVAGVVIFVVSHALTTGRIFDAALYGFFFGIVAYATYDLTNLAVVKDFPVKMATVDIFWGGFVTAVSASLATWIVLRVT